MTTIRRFCGLSTVCGLVALGLLGPGVPRALGATNWTVIGWNNLGMHCMDSDFSVFSILPPYNTINAQVVEVVDGSQSRILTTTNGVTLTYRAVADAEGSVNRSSEGKSNFREYSLPLYGVALPADTGLPVPGPESYRMPGAGNSPQRMGFESAFDWFVAYGIPITPYDDMGKMNQYGMMRLGLAAGGSEQATTDIVLPVSDEMDCKLCHGSGSGADARPAAGWEHDPDPGRDYRLNILRLHDEKQAGEVAYTNALAINGFNAGGLHATVTVDLRPVLCASCHLSEALPGSGIPGIAPLTAAVHGGHAGALDPRNGMALDAQANRSACYTCHPGSFTRCLRGAMGKAVAVDGGMAMQCQSCHGTMSVVGDPGRTGWLDEPTCQACHTGDAANNSGAIRYTSVFLTNGTMRAAPASRFATNPDTPEPGLSLYRFSRGHGGLQCSACHGATHAEYPSAYRNDNVQSRQLQGHEGMLVECTACHGPDPALSLNGGPHGMHTVGQAWVDGHHDAFEHDQTAQCIPCHGTDYRGTVLSRAQADRMVVADFDGTQRSIHLWRGYQVGCYTCHDGPDSSSPTSNQAPVASNVTAVTQSGVPVALTLVATDADGVPAAYRIVSQPSDGTVGLSAATATYYPRLGFSGIDSFTFAASDGELDSNLATGTVTVVEIVSAGDGIPDWWRRYYFGGDGSTTNSDTCAACDADGDGADNATEFGAGTDPTDGRSVLRIVTMERQTNDVRLVFTSLPTLQYEIQKRNDLLSGSWTTLQSYVWGRTDSVGTSVEPPAGRWSQFYRIRVSP